MRNLYVVTHPEATHHVERSVGGWYDSRLTTAGVIAANAIASALRARIPQGSEIELYSSDLQRTMQTARAIGARLNVEVRPDAGLREKSYGDAEGRPHAWLDERFVPPPVTGDRLLHDEGIRGAETRWSLASRVYASMARILANECEHQIVVTHGFAATMVLAAWIKMPIEAVTSVSFRVVSGSITDLRQDDFFNNREVVTLSDTTHLP